jgi:hypothetical protein
MTVSGNAQKFAFDEIALSKQNE